MKRVCLIVLIVLVSGVCQVYGAQFGPMKAATDAKGISLGAGYTYLPDEWDISAAGAENLEVQQNQGFLQLGASFSRFDIFVRGGVSDFQADGGFRFGDGDIESDPAPYGTAGVSVVLYDGEMLKVGPFLQGSYYDLLEAEGEATATDSTTGTTYTGKEKVFLDNLWSAEAGLKFQLEIDEALLYFGPAYFYNVADYRSVFTGDTTPPSGIVTSAASGDAEATNKVGGFVGAYWQLDDHYSLEIEAQIKQDVAFGGVLSYRF